MKWKIAGCLAIAVTAAIVVAGAIVAKHSFDELDDMLKGMIN